MGYYWFKEEGLIKSFGIIPKKINFSIIFNEEKQKRSEKRKKNN